MAKKNHPRQSRASKVGFLLAGASAPRSFQRSLMERDTVDQGIVTGLTMAIAYSLGALTQDGLEIIADQITNKSETDKSEANRDSSDNLSFWLSLGVIGAGIAVQRLFKQRSDEKMINATVRTGGHILARVGAAGVTTHGLEKLATKIAAGKTDRQSEAVYSMIVPTGALLAILIDRILYSNHNFKDTGNQHVQKIKSVGIGAAIVGGLAGLSFLERKTAKSINNALNKVAPSFNNSRLPVGHLLSFGLLSGGLLYVFKKLYLNIESAANRLETNYKKPPASKYVSGSKTSLVKWQTLSVEGRRHIGTRLTPKQIAPVIGTKIGEVREPIRIYIGLDSAPSEEDRVKLALDELKRVNAYSREYLVIISPTGSGYVNYVMSDAVEYMSAGNCALVTMQYSKRPSPLSLDRRDEGHFQYRLLINGIKKEVCKMPVTKRPKVILFGESLGAWTSQDAFMYEGTDGFEANLIDKALWIGTPAKSKWKERSLSGKTLNTDKEMVGVFDNHAEYLKLKPAERKKIRYFMVTHYNDPVARFTLSLLIQAPDWLALDEKRPPTIPKSALFRVPGTFVQTLIDMKNALKPIPGQFVATGHDYREDLAPFIRDIFDFKITKTQYEDIVQALKDNDIARAKKS